MTRNSNGASQVGLLHLFNVPSYRFLLLVRRLCNLQIWEINGIESTPPDLTLLKIINGATIASNSNVSQRTFILTKNEVVELRIHGADIKRTWYAVLLYLSLHP
jgi:hypothetical protein